MPSPWDVQNPWTIESGALLARCVRRFGIPTAYRRAGNPDFNISGIPVFNDRLENVNQGQFYSIFYIVSDFDRATFSASVTANFSGAPASDGILIFDGITYTSKQVLDNAVPYQFWRAGNALAAATNLAAAINAADGFSGTGYSSTTTAHPTCSAVASETEAGAAVVVSYRTPGLAGNLIEAEDHMSFVTLDRKVFYGGGPLENDLITLRGILYRASDVPEPDSDGTGIQVRLEKKAL